ncbi:uncharacterized protein LOC118429276 [Branchiostoma floridae]|uniref:Uncharacterized protein LOC118429276 n=1 Tax=Branchiostoma floridae TaxID=7739 RepID=A0A9J7M831_BRAFL|nr:uncharacterized protein LOC118429276 [Branchiostoma floridae]
MSRPSDSHVISIPEAGTATAMDDANSFFFPTSEHSSCYELPSIHTIASFGNTDNNDSSVNELGYSSNESCFSVNNVTVTCPEEEGAQKSCGSTSSQDSVNDGASPCTTTTTTTAPASTSSASTDPQCDLLMFLNVASNSIMRTLEKPRRLAGLKKRKVNHRRFIEKQLHKKHLAYPQFHSKVRSAKSKEFKQMRANHAVSGATPSSNVPAINPAIFNNNFIESPGPVRQSQQHWDCFQNDNIFPSSQLLDPDQLCDPLNSDMSFQSDSLELSDEAIDNLMRLCDMVSANSDDVMQQPCDFASFDSFAADSNNSNDSLSDLSVFLDSPLGTPNSGDFYGFGSNGTSFSGANPIELNSILDQSTEGILHTSPTSAYDQSAPDCDGLSFEMLTEDGYRRLPACMYDQRTGADLEKISERNLQDAMMQQDLGPDITSFSLEDVGLPFLF